MLQLQAALAFTLQLLCADAICSIVMADRVDQTHRPAQGREHQGIATEREISQRTLLQVLNFTACGLCN